jgi:hypothetical protein
MPWLVSLENAHHSSRERPRRLFPDDQGSSVLRDRLRRIRGLIDRRIRFPKRWTWRDGQLLPQYSGLGSALRRVGHSHRGRPYTSVALGPNLHPFVQRTPYGLRTAGLSVSSPSAERRHFRRNAHDRQSRIYSARSRSGCRRDLVAGVLQPKRCEGILSSGSKNCIVFL